MMPTCTITPPPEDQQQPLNEHFSNYSKKSRHGHGQDVVDDNNIRQVAGCIPLDLNNRRVLLISSRKVKDAWVLPKGGWEKDETQKHAAQRETWEEAGIKGTITRDLGVFEERTNRKKILKAHHWIFEMAIEEVAKKFPEKKKRERKWFTFEEALIATQDHRYIQEALLQSSLNPAKSPPSPRESLEDKNDKKQEVPSPVVVPRRRDFAPIQNIAATTAIPEPVRRNPSLMKSIKSIFQ